MTKSRPSATDGGTSEWRSGWPLVATSCVGMMVSVLHIYSMGVFMEPIQASTGWGRTQITGALTITSTTTVLFATLVGWMIDRFGARRIGIPGAAVYCLSFAALALVSDSVLMWWGMWVLVALGGLFIKPTVWTAAVATRFATARGLAFALTLCGTGLAASLAPIAAHHAIGAFGWRGAFLALGAGGAIVLLPAMLIWFREAGAQTGGVQPAKATPVPGAARRLMLSRRFLQLAGATFLVTAAITVLAIHFVPILRSRDIAAVQAASFAGIIGICSVLGRIAGGALLDRVNGRWIAGIAFALPCIACIALLGPMSTPVAIFAAVFVGLSLGAEIEVVAYLTTRYFGLRSYGLVFGTIIAFLSLGSGLGPLIAAGIYDTTGSYRIAIIAVMPLFLLATLLVTTLGAYPDDPDAALR